jgi:hypothetical protein
MQTNTNVLLEWRAPTRSDHKRSERWYIVMGTLCAVIVVYGIFSGTWSMSLVFAFIPALYWLLRNQAHKQHVIRIMTLGIEYDGVLLPWGDFKEFWILSGPNYNELHIAPVKKIRSEIVIQTGTIDPFVLRDVLAQFLPQIGDRHEKLLDAFIRFCKL